MIHEVLAKLGTAWDVFFNQLEPTIMTQHCSNAVHSRTVFLSAVNINRLDFPTAHLEAPSCRRRALPSQVRQRQDRLGCRCRHVAAGFLPLPPSPPEHDRQQRHQEDHHRRCAQVFVM